ncbi:MAG: cytochrome c [Verrucomicrobiota bacterium]
MKRGAILTFGGAIGFAALASALTALEIKLPAESARLAESPLPGYALAQSMCMTCHSVDYIQSQPKSPKTYWQGAVVKMQKVFGATIPDEAVAPIADYLAKTYGAEPAGVNAAAKDAVDVKAKK